VLVAPVTLLILEVDGRKLELGWKEAAALIAMRFVGWNAVTLSDLELVAGNYVGAINTVTRLKTLGLVSEYNVQGFKLYRLTELGARAAEELRRKAESAGLWKLVEEALGEA
jgi:hypothetical protein